MVFTGRQFYHAWLAGSDVQLGQRIAEINNDCLAHIHFGIYRGAADADGIEPLWLLGYLPNGLSCAEYDTPWPGNWTDPAQGGFAPNGFAGISAGSSPRQGPGTVSPCAARASQKPPE